MIGKLVAGIMIGGAGGALLGYFGKCSSGACPLTANPYRGAIYGATLGLLFTLAFSAAPKEELPRSSRRALGDMPAAGSSEEAPIRIDSESDFKARVLEAKGICLVDLFSNSCPPCRLLAPTIVSLAKRYAGRVAVCKVNIDLVPAVAEQYGINAIPTVLIIKQGKEVERLVGLRPESDYAAALDKLLEGRTQ